MSTCAISISCPCPTSPIGNLSCYDDDVLKYHSQVYGEEEPRIDYNYEAIGCIGVCESVISQSDADLCAANQATQCVKDGETDEDDDPVLGCWNSAQTGVAYCPDGNPFYYTVAAGSVLADSCALANQMAASMADQLAFSNRICLSDLPSGCCLNVAQSLEIVATGGALPMVFSLTSGDLPDGLSWSFNARTITIDGTPTVAGSFTFTFRVTDVSGRYMDKTYTLSVIAITTATPLTDGNVSDYYSETLACSGIAVPVWSVVSGTLPDGLTLDPLTGVIAGTPTTGSRDSPAADSHPVGNCIPVALAA